MIEGIDWLDEAYHISRQESDTAVDAAVHAFRRGTRDSDRGDSDWGGHLKLEQKVTEINMALGHYIANFDRDQMAEYVQRTS